MAIKVLFYQNPAAGLALAASRRALAQHLASTGQIELTMLEEAAWPAGADFLDRYEVVVLASPLSPGPVREEAATARMLLNFVQRGGGLVTLADSTDRWPEASTDLSRLMELKPGGRTTPTELIVRVPAATEHPITRRLYAGYAHDHYAGLDLDTAFALPEDSFWLSQERPAPSFEAAADRDGNGPQPLLLVSWQGQRLPVARVQPVERGFIFQTSLGLAPATWAHPVFRQLVFRAVTYSGRPAAEKPVRVAMLGYGAIGLEHATAIKGVPGLELAAVCDRNPARLAEARRGFEGISTFTDLDDITRDHDLDLVIISTPPDSHAAMAIKMLEAGKHVVVEKPFCLTGQEAGTMIELARQVERVLTVYQCRRWDPDYLAIQQAVESGQIGEIFHIETFIGSFSHPCDYWHSQEAVSGGVFYDWGSHYLDWILGLVPGRVQSVSGFSHKRVWHDVTNEDQARVMLRFEGGQEAEFMHSDIAAALKPKWYILGTRGAIVGHWREESVKTRRWSGDLIEERLAPSESLPVLTLHQRQGGGLVHQQKLALPPAPVFPFHRNLANHLHNGEPLAVPPQQARRNVAVMEAAKLSARRGGIVVPVEF